MIGLEVDGKPLLRAYSIAKANWDDELDFFSIKVPDGAITSRLQNMKVGDCRFNWSTQHFCENISGC